MTASRTPGTARECGTRVDPRWVWSGVRERFASEQPRSQCVFEHVYFARPDSYVFGTSVNEVRTNLGRILAREHLVDLVLRDLGLVGVLDADVGRPDHRDGPDRDQDVPPEEVCPVRHASHKPLSLRG